MSIIVYFAICGSYIKSTICITFVSFKRRVYHYTILKRLLFPSKRQNIQKFTFLQTVTDVPPRLLPALSLDQTSV